MRQLAVGTGVWLVMCGGSALAQTAPAPAPQPDAPPSVQEIIVTAQKRAENLQDVPVSVTALSAQALQDRHVADLLDLSNLAPGLQIKTDDTAANPRIFIRGVGLNDFNPATASPIGIYVDGVYVTSPLAQLASMYDLERVEVLRGPQGTLYGRNTTGGAINIISRKPTDTFEADASIEYGRFNSVDVRAAMGGPLIEDKLAFRVAGIYQRDDGYTLNRLTDHTGNNTDRYDVRASLLWTPDKSFDADLVVHMGQSRGGSIWAYNRSLLPQTAAATGPDGLCAPGFYTSGQCTNILGYANTSSNLYQGDYRIEGRDQVKLFGTTLTLNKDLGFASLVSITGYQRADRNDQEDTDANPLPVISASYIAREETFSQELRLQSPSKTNLRYVFGLYYAYDYLNNNSSYSVLPTLQDPSNAALDLQLGIANVAWPFRQVIDSYAAFGQVDYDITPRLTLTGGLRYSAEHKGFDETSLATSFDYTFFNFADNKTFDSISGRFAIKYKLTDTSNVYFSYNRGFKSGGFFSGQTTEVADVGPYKNENVNAYEVGAKSELFGRMLRADVSGFYYDYTNLQVYSTVQRGLITEQLFTNASAARIYGGEIELASSPLRGLDLSAGLSLLSATYVDFVSQGMNYSGNQLPSAPHESLNASARYVHPLPLGDLVSEVDLNYRSQIFFDTSNDPRLSDPQRAFVDAELGWRAPNGRFELGVWGRNLFDETNISDITPVPALGFDAISVGKPRTYGLYLRAHY
jgi:iron complex outermembrane receptor protein